MNQAAAGGTCPQSALKRPNSLVAFLLLAIVTSALAADKDELRKENWQSVYIRQDNTPLYAAPSITAEVIVRDSKGSQLLAAFEADNKKLRSAAENKQIFYNVGGMLPGGRQIKTDWWVRHEDIAFPIDFRRVTKWPIRYLLRQREFFQFVSIFTPDGEVTTVFYDEENPNGKVLSRGHLYMLDGIVIYRDSQMDPSLWPRHGGSLIALFDSDTKCALHPFADLRVDCSKARDPKYIAMAADYAQALFTDPPKPLYLDKVCVADCGEKYLGSE